MQLDAEIATARQIIAHHNNQLDKQEGDQSGVKDINEARVNLTSKRTALDGLIKRVNGLSTPGEFLVKSPMTGILLSSDFKEKLEGRHVRPSEPLLRIGQVDPSNPKTSDWEAEVKIPQRHIGQVLKAFQMFVPNSVLDVPISILASRAHSGPSCRQAQQEQSRLRSQRQSRRQQ